MKLKALFLFCFLSVVFLFSTLVVCSAQAASYRTFSTSEGGSIDIFAFNKNGEPMQFYEGDNDNEYLVNDANAYTADDMSSIGESLSVSNETVNLIFNDDLLDSFHVYDRAMPGYALYSFVDESCQCTIYTTMEGAANIITLDMPENIGVVFRPTGEEILSPVANGIQMTLDGVSVSSEVSPYMENDRTMVPIRFVSEALGATVGWEGDSGLVTVKSPDGLMIRMTIGDKSLETVRPGKKTETTTMEVPPIIRDGRTFIPVRYVAEALGLVVDWDGATQTVLLYS